MAIDGFTICLRLFEEGGDEIDQVAESRLFLFLLRLFVILVVFLFSMNLLFDSVFVCGHSILLR